MNCINTDLSQLFDFETENAAPAGPRNGVEIKAELQSARPDDSVTAQAKQAWDDARRWVAWREDDRNGKPAKVPYCTPRRMARSDDPATWLTRPQAEVVAADLLSAGQKGGVGLMLGGDAAERLGGIDLDSCLDPLSGQLEPWAAEIIDRFASYAEVSPSGAGVKVFFTYAAADLEPLRAIMGTLHGKSWSRGSHHEIALHLGNRYFTVTERRLDHAPADIRPVDRAALQWLIEDAGPRFKGDAPKAAAKDESRSGRAFRLAGTCRRAGMDLDGYRAELRADPDLAEWAKDARQVRRAWANTAAPDVGADDFDDLPAGKVDRQLARIHRINETHAAVMVGGKFRIIHEKPNNDFELFAPEEWHKLHDNWRIRIGDSDKAVTREWMKHKQRRTYAGGLVFNPKETPAGAYNIWRGWAVQPDPDASCALFLHHLRTIICDGDDRDYQWLLGWMAHLVQHPAEKPGTALVLRGAKGAGKDTVGTYLGKLFPRHHVTIAQPEHLTGRFNSHMETALLLHLEEGFWAGDKQGESVLKNLITCNTLQIERKGVDPYEIGHFARLMVTSNAEWVVPATRGERRFFVLDVSPARAKDATYFAAIAKERDNGGAGALLHFLQSYDLSCFDVRNPPATGALTRQKLEGLRNIEAWWHDRLSEGDLRHGDGYDEKSIWEQKAISVSRDWLRRDYEDWLGGQRWHGNAVSARQFGKDLRAMCGQLEDHRAHAPSGRQWQYIIPPLSVCRAAFAAYIEGDIEW